MKRPTHHYVGRCKQCGAVWSSTWDIDDDPKGTAEAVARVVAAGRWVERVPAGNVEISFDGCECHTKAADSNATPANPVGGLPLFAKEQAV